MNTQQTFIDPSNPILGRMRLFRGMNTGDIYSILEGKPIQKHIKGSIITKEKEKRTTLLIVLEGKVRVTIEDRHGINKELNVIRQGEFFGEMALFKHGYRQATVTATSEVQVIEIPFQEIVGLMNKFEPVKANIFRTYKKRIENNQKTIEEEGIERRHEIRVDVRLPCKLSIDLQEKSTGILSGTLLNISLGGALISLNASSVKGFEKSLKGRTAEVVFQLIRDEPEMKFKAIIVRMDKSKNNQIPLALSITDINRFRKDELDNFITRSLLSSEQVLE